jgi:type II secretory pathway pseudopilin PulG
MTPMTTDSTRGFTLVETLVTVGVLVFLVGLVLSVGSAVAERSARLRTETSLRLLDQALAEWETSARRQLSWWNYANPDDDPAHKDLADIHGDTPESLIITEMLDLMLRVPSAAQIIGQIEPGLIYTYRRGTHPPWIMQEPGGAAQQDARFDGSITVLDAWGVPIYATHPGRTWIPADAAYGAADADGTIHTYNEMRYGVARNRAVRFVSAGPDGDFGWVSYPPGTPDREAVADNLFSYPLEPGEGY